MRRFMMLLLILGLIAGSLIGCASNDDNQAPPVPNQSEVPETQSQEVTLYFANQNATAVAAEKRNIVLTTDSTREELFRSVLEELIKGPESTILYKTIPIEVKINSVELNGDILSVDFSQEMHINHWGGATGEAMTINSIVNTLTEFNDVNKVKMTVEGQPMSIEHSILEEPVGRNEDMIQK
ncbi:MAG: GerMN domain-containing protein [Vulcanibacillus sp.]